jgi:hypothetical protein
LQDYQIHFCCFVHHNRIVTNEAAKDKNGSNPFYHGELLMAGNSSGHKEDSGNEKQAITTSIFA